MVVVVSAQNCFRSLFDYAVFRRLMVFLADEPVSASSPHDYHLSPFPVLGLPTLTYSLLHALAESWINPPPVVPQPVLSALPSRESWWPAESTHMLPVPVTFPLP